MLNEGKIQSFPDIFKFIKKSVVAADLGKRGPRFTEYTRIKLFSGTRANFLIIGRWSG